VHQYAAYDRKALAAEAIMTIPIRGQTSCTTYFITAATYCRMRLLQSERRCNLLCETLAEYRSAGKFLLQAFVIMPDHMHLLLSVPKG